MSRKPSYPKDAAVGDTAADAGHDVPETGAEGRRKKQLVTGAAIGIGSAAIVAALLYARKRKSDR
jgi:hypothetical protein